MTHFMLKKVIIIIIIIILSVFIYQSSDVVKTKYGKNKVDSWVHDVRLLSIFQDS